MAERYNIQYDDVIGNGFEISIYNSTYAGASTSLNGSAIYGMNALDSMTDPVRSKYLKLNLLANETNTLSDLLDAEEREWSVTLSRDSSIIFFGYLTSEGVTQSYVTMERFVSFDVLDPLAFLEDLAYTDNSGNSYEGHDELAHIIAKCLQRGFEPTPTSAWFNQIKAWVPYDSWFRPIGAASTPYSGGDFLKQHTLDQSQWIDEDSGDETKSCLEVLKEVLFSLNLVISQINGDSWIIYHYLYDMSAIDSKYISYYDYDGDTITPFTLNPFSTEEILTDSVINQGALVHCNENQSYLYKRGLKKLVLEQEFVYEKDIIENWEFDGGTTGSGSANMPSWTIETGTYGYAVNNGTVRLYVYDSGVLSSSLAIYSSPTVQSNIPPRGAMKVVGSFMAVGYDDAIFRFNVKVDTGSGDPYYISWAPDSGGVIVPVWAQNAGEPSNNPLIPVEWSGEVVNFEYALPTPLPAGVITIRLYASSWGVSGSPGRDPGRYIELYEINVVGDESNRTGTSYVLDMTNDLSLRSERKDIYVGTWLYNTIANNLRRVTTGYPVVLIDNQVTTGIGAVELGTLVGKLYLYSQRRRIIFNGDVFGFIEPGTFLEIADLSSNDFVILEYSYDTYNNVISLKLEERINSYAITGVSIEAVYKNVIEPTIKS